MRRNNGRRLRTCEICDATYRPTYSAQRTCSRKCGEILRRTITGALPNRWPSSRIYVRACDQCGKLFTSQYARKRLRCSDECSRLANNAASLASVKARYAADPAFRDRVIAIAHARRAGKLGVKEITSRQDLTAYLTTRDHGRCGICHQPVRARQGSRRPSIDHIVPLAQGGTHDLANLQLAHLSCNLAKHARGGGEQLLLIG